MAKQTDERVQPYSAVPKKEKGLGPDSAGQSGDTQGLSDIEESSNESVEELLEEGQYAEAAAVSGVEDAPDADVSEVRTKQVPANDVPPEYWEKDPTERTDQ